MLNVKHCATVKTTEQYSENRGNTSPISDKPESKMAHDYCSGLDSSVFVFVFFSESFRDGKILTGHHYSAFKFEQTQLYPETDSTLTDNHEGKRYTFCL